MLAAVGHAALQQAVHQALGQQAHHARVPRKGAVTNDAALAKVQVQHRREAEVHTAGAQLGAQHKAAGRGRIGGFHGASALAGLAVLQPQLAQGAHGRQVGEAIGLEALHAAAFMVHANQQVAPYFFNLTAQLGELGAVLPVAAKQNDAAHQRVLQTFAVDFGQTQTSDVDDEGGMGRHGLSFRQNKIL